jgi:hypothetical protein
VAVCFRIFLMWSRDDAVVLEGRADLGLVVVLPTCFRRFAYRSYQGRYYE